MTTPAKRGINYEKKKARDYKAKHVGGPGKPDAVRGGKGKIEIKDWKAKVHTGVLRKALRRRIKTIVSKSGYTDPAKEYGKKHGMKLK